MDLHPYQQHVLEADLLPDPADDLRVEVPVLRGVRQCLGQAHVVNGVWVHDVDFEACGNDPWVPRLVLVCDHARPSAGGQLRSFWQGYRDGDYPVLRAHPHSSRQALNMVMLGEQQVTNGGIRVRGGPASAPRALDILGGLPSEVPQPVIGNGDLDSPGVLPALRSLWVHRDNLVYLVGLGDLGFFWYCPRKYHS